MRITRISIRRKKLNALFFDESERPDGEYSSDGGLLIDRGVFEQSGYEEGSLMSTDDVCELIAASRCARAYSRGLWLLDTRDYTRKGMYDKLRVLFGDEAAEYAADRLEEAGFIDDARFAARAAELMLGANRSRRDIVTRLMRKGVAREIALDAVSDAANDAGCDPVEQIKTLIDKKYASRLAAGDKKERQKIIAALARRGFDYEDIRSALNAPCDEYYD